MLKAWLLVTLIFGLLLQPTILTLSSWHLLRSQVRIGARIKSRSVWVKQSELLTTLQTAPDFLSKFLNYFPRVHIPCLSSVLCTFTLPRRFIFILAYEFHHLLEAGDSSIFIASSNLSSELRMIILTLSEIYLLGCPRDNSFIYSFSHSFIIHKFNKHFLSTSYLPGSVLGLRGPRGE